MAKFTVRVVLHKVKSLDDDAYTRLHAAMKEAQFSTFIKGSNGTVYKLPPGEYYCFGNDLTLDEVRAEAYEIAKSIDDDCGVLVTEGILGWIGLKPKAIAAQRRV